MIIKQQNEMEKKGKTTGDEIAFFNLTIVSPNVNDLLFWKNKLSDHDYLEVRYLSSMKQLMKTLPDLVPDAVIIDDYLPLHFPLSMDMPVALAGLLKKAPGIICYYYGINYRQFNDINLQGANVVAGIYSEESLHAITRDINDWQLRFSPGSRFQGEVSI